MPRSPRLAHKAPVMQARIRLTASVWTVLFPGGVLPYKSLMGMCRWMGSHFHDWSDYNGVAFSIELLEWGRKFSNFGGK